jgi:hypothetical protein
VQLLVNFSNSRLKFLPNSQNNENGSTEHEGKGFQDDWKDLLFESLLVWILVLFLGTRFAATGL